MTVLHLADHGDTYRVEIDDGHVVVSHRADDGIWTVEARMPVRAGPYGGVRPSTNTVDVEQRWVSAMPHQAIEAIAGAADAVRTANHAGLHRNDFDHHDLYELMGEVSQLAHRLPQLIVQAGDILRRLDRADRIDVDHHNLPATMTAWNQSTAAAVAVAEQLAQHIDRAFSELSAVRSNTSNLNIDAVAEPG